MLFLAHAQAQQYSFVNYSIKEGLVQSQVNALCQDDEGYMWAGTIAGLSRFDGLEFVNYTTKDGLIDNQIFTIFKDHLGRLWFGSKGGVSLYENGKFRNYAFRKEQENNYVLSIAEESNGRMWFGTDWGGVVTLQNETLNYYNAQNGLIDDTVRDIYIDANGAIWFATLNGLSVFRNSNFEAEPYPQLTGTNIGGLCSGKDGELWMATAFSGLGCLKDDKLRFYTEQNGLHDNHTEFLFRDESGNIWISLLGGITKFDGNVFTHFGKKEGLPITTVKSITQGNEGNIWLASDGAGIFRFAGQAFVNFDTKNGFTSNYVMSVVEDTSNNLWFGTYDAGVCLMEKNPLNNAVSYKKYDERDGFAHLKVWCSILDRKGQLWFGTSQGISRRKADGSYSNIDLDNGLIDMKITALYEDNEGTIWVGHRSGISTIKGNEIRNYGTEDGFSGIKIRNIKQDASGKIWFGAANGLYSLNNGEFEQHQSDNKGFGLAVQSLFIDVKSTLWIGTTEGLFSFDGTETKKYDLSTNINSNTINFVIQDDYNQLWVGTNNGLFRLDLPSLYDTGNTDFSLYTDLDGIPSLETNLNSAFKDSEGNLWMGTSEGTVRYNPSEERNSNKNIEPFIHISGLRLFLQPTDWSSYSDSTNEVGLPTALSLPHSKNYLTFDFTGISLSNPGKVRYRFQLKNFDEDWLPLTNATFATYSNLPAGDYVFCVEALNKDGLASANPAEFPFTIRTPYYKQWWFIALCFLVIGSILYYFYHQRIVRIQKEKEREQLSNRSKMLALEQQTLNASMNRHFIFNALNSIQYYINSNDRYNANTYLTSFAKLVRKNLDSSGVNSVSLSDELERLELYLKLELMRFQGKFEYTINVEPSISTETVKVPAMLLQPFVENSIWHGILPSKKDGDLKISITSENGGMLISIEDNGIGIEASRRAKSGKTHISKGMAITNSRITLLNELSEDTLMINGPYELKSEDGTVLGTCVEIVLPFNYEDWHDKKEGNYLENNK